MRSYRAGFEDVCFAVSLFKCRLSAMGYLVTRIYRPRQSLPYLVLYHKPRRSRANIDRGDSIGECSRDDYFRASVIIEKDKNNASKLIIIPFLAG